LKRGDGKRGDVEDEEIKRMEEYGRYGREWKRMSSSVQLVQR